MIDNYAVVDLFCGVGGLTQGFVQEGFNVVAGIDFDKTCKYAYEKNNNTTFLHKDISKLTVDELKALFPEGKKKILIGCAPCQPYSIFNRNQPKPETALPDADDPRWLLLYSFSKLIVELKPEIVSMENVPLLKNFKGGKVFNDFVNLLRENGYQVTFEIHDAQNFGVPQRRKRLVLLASLGENIRMIPSTHVDAKVTVKDAIGHLPLLNDGEVNTKDPLHRSRKLTEITKKRIQATKEGGSWKDWDEELKLECHKNEGGKLYGSVYGRMSWSNVAPTMTTYCTGLNNGRFGHPNQDRAISLREAALLQSFPETYDFIDDSQPFSAANLAKHIGNAVPVGLGIAVAKSIKNYIEQFDN